MDDLEQVLDDCLENLSRGSSLDECLARYPGETSRLRPLLETAAFLEQGSQVQPSPAFRARARARLMSAHAQASQPVWRRQPGLHGWKLAASTAAFVVVLLTTETGFAQGALPGSPLYGWKLASERVWRDVSSDLISTDLAIANRRADEWLIVRQDPQFSDRALNEYREVLIRLTANTDVDSRARIMPVLELQWELFENAGVSVPELEAYLQADYPETPSAPEAHPTKVKKPNEGGKPSGSP